MYQIPSVHQSSQYFLLLPTFLPQFRQPKLDSFTSRFDTWKNDSGEQITKPSSGSTFLIFVIAEAETVAWDGHSMFIKTSLIKYTLILV